MHSNWDKLDIAANEFSANLYLDEINVAAYPAAIFIFKPAITAGWVGRDKRSVPGSNARNAALIRAYSLKEPNAAFLFAQTRRSTDRTVKPCQK